MNINQHHQCNNVPSKLKFHQVRFPFNLHLLTRKKEKEGKIESRAYKHDSA